MGCGCGKRARLKSEGKEITGYRVVLGGISYPPEDKPPYMSTPEARAQVRALGGGTVRTETRMIGAEPQAVH